MGAVGYYLLGTSGILYIAQLSSTSKDPDPTLWRAAEGTDHTHLIARVNPLDHLLHPSLSIPSDPTFFLCRPPIFVLEVPPCARHRIGIGFLATTTTTPAAYSSPIAVIRVSPRRSSHTIFCPAFQCAQHRRTVVDLQPARRSAPLRTSAEENF